MVTRLARGIFASAATGLAVASLAVSAQNQNQPWHKGSIAVHMLGTDYVEERMVPDIDGDGADDLARCFDMKLLDVKTGKQIGTGADCVANLTPVGGGLQIDATYYLNLKGGSIVVRGKNTAQPLLRETTSTATGEAYSHSVAASGNWNAKLAGTGLYAEGEAKLRVSGLMNINGVKGQVDDVAFLDLILMIDLD